MGDTDRRARLERPVRTLLASETKLQNELNDCRSRLQTYKEQLDDYKLRCERHQERCARERKEVLKAQQIIKMASQKEEEFKTQLATMEVQRNQASQLAETLIRTNESMQTTIDKLLRDSTASSANESSNCTVMQLRLRSRREELIQLASRGISYELMAGPNGLLYRHYGDREEGKWRSGYNHDHATMRLFYDDLFRVLREYYAVNPMTVTAKSAVVLPIDHPAHSEAYKRGEVHEERVPFGELFATSRKRGLNAVFSAAEGPDSDKLVKIRKEYQIPVTINSFHSHRTKLRDAEEKTRQYLSHNGNSNVV